MRGKHDPNPALQGLIYLILILGLANDSGKPSQWSPWIFFILIASICIYMVFFCASENPILDYFAAIPITATFFVSLNHVLLGKYQRGLQPSGEKLLSEMPFRDRLWWAVDLSGNPRGIGWTHEPTLSRPSSTPQKFILSQLIWMVFYILLYDIANIFVRANPCFATGGPSLTAFGWLWRSTALLHVLLAYSILSVLHIAYSIISVAIGLSKPRDWPPLFGSLLNAYTLRNCWSRVWHQILRKALTGHANFITKQLRLPKSKFTTCVKLFIAFFLSGLIHHAAEYVIWQKWAGYSMEFFLLQAVAITCEDVVITLATRAGFCSKPNSFLKFVGLVWVFNWFTYCLPMWLDDTIHAGLMDDGLKISLILGVWRGDWTPSR